MKVLVLPVYPRAGLYIEVKMELESIVNIRYVQHKEYRDYHKEEISKRRKTKRLQNRINCMNLLGGLYCSCCGNNIIEHLTIDHINGLEGNRRLNSDEVYRSILKHPYPKEKFRVLCWNCNGSMGTYGYCPCNWIMEE